MPPWFAPVLVGPGALEAAIRDDCPSVCVFTLQPGVYLDAVLVAAGQDVTLEGAGAELEGVVTVEPGGTLTVRDALLHGTVVVLGTVTLDNPSTKGGGRSAPLIEVSAYGAVLTVNGGELAGFTTDSSVVVVQEGDVTFDGTVMRDNFASPTSPGGAAIRLVDGLVRLQDATVHQNMAPNQPGGAILQTGGRLELFRTSLTSNAALNGGAVATQGGELSVEQGTFVENQASYDGGAIQLTGGAVAEIHTDFVDNLAGTLGGGLSGIGVSLEVSGSRFVRNAATSGGGVYFLGDLIVEDTTFEDDSASAAGGSVFTTGSPDISGSQFTGSSAPTGAAIYVTGAGAGARVAESAFCDLQATSGTAVHVDTSSATVRIEHTLFGGGLGGAVTADQSDVELSHVTVIDLDQVGWAVDSGDLTVVDSLVGPLGVGDAFVVDGTSTTSLSNVHFDPAPILPGAVIGAPVLGPVSWLGSVVPTGYPWDPPCLAGPEFRIHPESAQYQAGVGGVDVGALGVANGPWALDRDGDLVAWTYDCDDADPTVHGFAVEWCNGLDDDCDGAADEAAVGVRVDADSDGFGVDATTCVPGGTAVVPADPYAPVDCNDGDASQFPGAPEIPGDSIDQDCDGLDDPGDSGAPPADDTGAASTGPTSTGPTSTGPTSTAGETPLGGEAVRSTSRAGAGRCDCDAGAAPPGPAAAFALALGAVLGRRRQRSQQ